MREQNHGVNIKLDEQSHEATLLNTSRRFIFLYTFNSSMDHTYNGEFLDSPSKEERGGGIGRFEWGSGEGERG